MWAVTEVMVNVGDSMTRMRSHKDEEAIVVQLLPLSMLFIRFSCSMDNVQLCVICVEILKLALFAE